MTSRTYWISAFWSCAAVVLVLSLLPPADFMPTTGWDKSNHVIAFFALAVLGCRAYSRDIIFVMVGLLLYGGLIEVLQFFVSYRSAEWVDLIADIVGLVTGWGVVSVLRKSQRSRQL